MFKTAVHEKKILLVEDDRTHRELTSQILENIGCKVTVAYDGDEAIRFLQKQEFDIILMDIYLPKMSGIEATRRIVDLQRHGDLNFIPIVGISSNHDEETEKLCLEAGMKGLIPKSLWKPNWEPNIVSRLQEFL